MTEGFGHLLADTLRQMLDQMNATRDVARGNSHGLMALLQVLADKGVIDAADIQAVAAAMEQGDKAGGE